MNIHFILVEPAVPENIGASARALKTMGFDSLWLVNTKAHLDPKASWVAHASDEILDEVRVFDRLADALAELDFSIATSAKTRSVRQEYYMAENVPAMLEEKSGLIKHAGIVFGREESGLKNDELKQCDIISRLPMHTTYPSLNLGQAVMIYAYLFSSRRDLTKESSQKQQPGEFRALKCKVERILPLLDLPPSTNIYRRIFERLMHIKQDDIHLLHSISNEILKKLDHKS
jgi:tRNA/rRNA methyltransferase